jgi:hypothetical protein
LNDTSAGTFLVWEAIRLSSGVTRRFDFDGSMLEGVEHFIRRFGAVQKPYFSITHTPSRFLRVKSTVRELANLLLRK